MTEKKHFNRLRWTARIWGAVVLAIILYLVVTEFVEEVKGQSPSPFVTLINGQYFLFITWTIAFLGLILAYWKDGLGGGISLASFMVFFIGWAETHWGFILMMVLVSFPSILYLLYWWKLFQSDRQKNRS